MIKTDVSLDLSILNGSEIGAVRAWEVGERGIFFFIPLLGAVNRLN